MSKTVAFFLFGAIASVPAAAQTFQAGRLPAASRDSFEVVYQGQTIGTFVIGLARAGDRFTMTNTASLPQMGVQQFDTVVFNAISLAPMSSVNRQTMTGMTVVSRVTFANGRAMGKVERPSPRGAQTVDLNAPVGAGVIIDGMDAVLIPTIDLSEALTLSFSSFDPKTGGTKNFELKVLSRENGDVPEGRIDAWKVQIVGDETVHMWVTVTEPRKIVKIRLESAQMEMRRVK